MTTVRVDPEGPEAPASVLLAHTPQRLNARVRCRCGAQFDHDTGGWPDDGTGWERLERQWAEHAVANLWPAMEAHPF